MHTTSKHITVLFHKTLPVEGVSIASYQCHQRACLMKAWKEEDGKQLERNEAHRQEFEYKEELRQWEEEQAKAKLEKRRLRYVKPKLRRLEVSLPKPTLTHIDEEEPEENESDEDSKEEH
ncbi:uncharacterized protein EDB91DRAFT_1079671 [Suillus paluster]|uniref:uncharacterized protein n=1 Tax=Suillus paluster TaxID=48578 RepID=UPI001B87D812|nr:uncharacterized protein EDB91DRAFT_1079671 [Suillus paluster]KAG1747030.1 hypothetical protein EDB91DRAFT_1079671 [Suillus paluster]